MIPPTKERVSAERFSVKWHLLGKVHWVGLTVLFSCETTLALLVLIFQSLKFGAIISGSQQTKLHLGHILFAVMMSINCLKEKRKEKKFKILMQSNNWKRCPSHKFMI